MRIESLGETVFSTTSRRYFQHFTALQNVKLRKNVFSSGSVASEKPLTRSNDDDENVVLTSAIPSTDLGSMCHHSS